MNPCSYPHIGQIVVFTHDAQTSREAGGNCYEGTICPAIVVAVWDAEKGYVNLKVLNDSGKDTWVTSVLPGNEKRHWQRLAATQGA